MQSLMSWDRDFLREGAAVQKALSPKVERGGWHQRSGDEGMERSGGAVC